METNETDRIKMFTELIEIRKKYFDGELEKYGETLANLPYKKLERIYMSIILKKREGDSGGK